MFSWLLCLLYGVDFVKPVCILINDKVEILFYTFIFIVNNRGNFLISIAEIARYAIRYIYFSEIKAKTLPGPGVQPKPFGLALQDFPVLL